MYFHVGDLSSEAHKQQYMGKVGAHESTVRQTHQQNKHGYRLEYLTRNKQNITNRLRGLASRRHFQPGKNTQHSGRCVPNVCTPRYTVKDRSHQAGEALRPSSVHTTPEYIVAPYTKSNLSKGHPAAPPPPSPTPAPIPSTLTGSLAATGDENSGTGEQDAKGSRAL